MIVVLQRVKFASCEVAGKIVSAIDKGILLLVGISKEDDFDSSEKIIKKIVNLRIFEDENYKMNNNIFQANGEILVISQFTLTANIKNGNRPSFDSCMEPQKAKEIFENFIIKLKQHKINVKEGVFGEHMIINIVNDGPVTFVLDSKKF
ncbi:MAG: D-tyrosyl-tRNA(Tyr) deacylase [Spirochaetales bacterium]|jgi:D-tyrosyl-tRNA(Tyr) deacylase|nr:D-aminoacyl-tRNA deacylase [Exilispira sp.]NMC68089.1 D-tyrosyl-tRNA(Tyr) deacylase [Spirochaetales bacterium]